MPDQSESLIARARYAYGKYIHDIQYLGELKRLALKENPKDLEKIQLLEVIIGIANTTGSFERNIQANIPDWQSRQ